MAFFTNKVVWITGASSGIGEALVYAFAHEGARVIISARRTEELSRVSQQAGGTGIYRLPLDLEQADTLVAKAEEAIRAFGHIDILVHNGGVSQRSWVAETGMDVHRRLMEIDYFSYVALTRAILPHFQQRKSGHFVVMSSVMGKIGTPMRSAYAAAKHALHGFFDCLRAEVWPDNIRVTLICPGYIRTHVSMNALTATGAALGEVGNDIGNGYPADKTAAQILAAIRTGRYEVFVGRRFSKEHLSLFMTRFFPGPFTNIVKNQIPK